MKNYFLLIISSFLISQSQAQVTASANCTPSLSYTDLDIANVRTRIMINGDMWWDLVGTAQYEVPKGSSKKSLFAGALWIGGKDALGNLKLAAQTYRQSGSDFWPGPIDTNNTSITAGRCLYYDRHWKITRQEVYDFINGAAPTQAIIDWPGNGDPSYGEAQFLAPFYDSNGDGIYDYTNGDYPKYEFGIQSSNVYDRLNGDQTIWWVFNDVGNIHAETNGASIGLEIQAQAFAFCTADTDLGNSTFYTYKIINRSSSTLFETYIGNWTDADLGYYLDDYVGCDVGRNLGFAYNGDIYDDLPTGYGSSLPAVGIDVLDAPVSPSMSSFHYYNNDASVTGNPNTAQEYYFYLDHRWKDGTIMTYGGTGYDLSSNDSALYMFPDSSDPSHIGTFGIDLGFDWSERLIAPGSGANQPGDRRFLMSSGKINLAAGSINYITKAAVWVGSGGPSIDTSVMMLKTADDKIQNFFDSHFNNIPTCPLVTGVNELTQSEYLMYPVPAKEFITFQFTKKYHDINIEIYDLNGKLVHQSDHENGDQLRINLSTWSSGNYLFKIVCDQKQTSGKFNISK